MRKRNRPTPPQFKRGFSDHAQVKEQSQEQSQEQSELQTELQPDVNQVKGESDTPWHGNAPSITDHLMQLDKAALESVRDDVAILLLAIGEGDA